MKPQKLSPLAVSEALARALGFDPALSAYVKRWAKPPTVTGLLSLTS